MLKQEVIRLIEEHKHILKGRGLTLCHVMNKFDLDFALVSDLFYRIPFEMKEFNHPLNEGKHGKLIRARLTSSLREMRDNIDDAIEAMKNK